MKARDLTPYGSRCSSVVDAARRAFPGAVDRFIREDADGLHLDGTVSVGGLGGDDARDGTFDYYMSEPLRVDDNKGVGPFILAGLELEAAIQGAEAHRP